MAAPGNAEVALTWNASTSATWHNVKQAASATGPLTVVATNLLNPGLVITNLGNGTTYFFAVSSVSDGFESADTVRLRAVPSARVLDLLPAGTKLEKLASGFATFPSIEGPVWSQTDRRLIFSDNVGDRLMQWTPSLGIPVSRQPGSRPNGNALDLQGRLIMALTWSSVPGKIYRVSRQADPENLESVELSAPITATAMSTSWTNNLPFIRRVQFFRVNVQ